MGWRDPPALRGGGFGFLLDYNNWIKKGGAVVGPLGCWGAVAKVAVCSDVISCLGLCTAIRHVLLLLSSYFQSWELKLRRAKWPSGVTRSQACSADGTTTANGAGCVLLHSTVGGRGAVMQSPATSGQFFLATARPGPSPSHPQSGDMAGPSTEDAQAPGCACGVVVGAPGELG